MDRVATGDFILPDRGFTLAEEFAQSGAILKIPAFITRCDQMAPRDVDETRKLANVRIYFERVIGLNCVLLISIADMTDDI